MDRLLSSLLCCSVDSKDDANDKVHSQTRSTAANPGNPSSDGASSPAKSPRKAKTPSKNRASRDIQSAPVQNGHLTNTTREASKKEAFEDDHSVNETDTITNTNDDANNTPTSAPNHTEAAVGTAYSEPGKTSDKDAAPAVIDELLDENTPDETDEESFLDLTKFQDGQSFNPETGWLLGKKDPKYGNKKCLILDLDETLVHSSFKYLRTADFVIPVEIDNQVHHVYVIKRPGVDEFLRKVGQWFEVVVFTASVSKYGDPLLDKLDWHKAVHHRLFRDSCYNYQGNFIKNLSQIGRPLADSIIIDNSPASYIFHPQHSIPISSWFSDTHDNELLDLLPFLKDISEQNVDDVGLVLDITL